MSNVFSRSGIAALSDLKTEEWRKLFRLLEQEQSEFRSMEARFRSSEYGWPLDPLHTWSRIWEYPYVYEHMKANRRSSDQSASPFVVDVGSGVTFFPFSVARLGYKVVCTDIDPLCARDIPLAANVLRPSFGSVDFRLLKGDRLPFENNEVDVAYCVSVLEHIPEPQRMVMEIFRVLKPGGLFLLTIDLDLKGDSEIGVVPHERLVEVIGSCFEYEFPETTVHPANILNTTNGPFKFPVLSGLARQWFLFKQLVKPWLGKQRRPLYDPFLAVQGFVLRRKVVAPAPA